MRPAFALLLSLGILLPGAWAIAPRGDAPLVLAPGADAPASTLARDGSIRLKVESMAGATVGYDEVARLSYRGETPATVRVAIHGGPEWALPLPELVTMAPGASLSIPLTITLADGADRASSATLLATIVS